MRTFVQLCININEFKNQDQLLENIARIIRQMIPADGGAVLMWNKTEDVLVAKAVDFKDAAHAAQFETRRIPVGEGVAGRVFETGVSRVANGCDDGPHIDRSAGLPPLEWIRNRIDVPLKIHGRKVGVLTTVNKRRGDFHQKDVDLLASVAGVSALAMENIRIRESLADYYRRMKDFNRAKDRVIHQISHALKTPLAVLIASLKLLHKHLMLSPDTSWLGIYDRAQRNLTRLLAIEYEMEDILRQRPQSDRVAASLATVPGAPSDDRPDEHRGDADSSDHNGGKS